MDVERGSEAQANAPEFWQQMASVEVIHLAEIEHEIAVLLDPHVCADITVAERHRTEGIPTGRIPRHITVIERLHHFRRHWFFGHERRRGHRRLAGSVLASPGRDGEEAEEEQELHSGGASWSGSDVHGFDFEDFNQVARNVRVISDTLGSLKRPCPAPFTV